MSEPKLSKVSCDQCRFRKSYCDKNMPSCLKCDTLGRSCSYLYVPKVRPKKYNKSKKATSQLKFKAWETNTSKTEIFKDNDKRKLVVVNSLNRDLMKGNNKNLFVSSGGYMMATNIFKNSVMNKNHKVFTSNSGKIDYFGVSPLALLLTMYVVHNTQPEHLKKYVSTLNSSPGSDSNQGKNLPVRYRFLMKQLEQSEVVESVMKIAVEAFFKYFHPHLPVLNRAKFKLKFTSQPKQLQYIVVGIGLGYLPYMDPSIKYHYCRLAQLELNKSYSKMSLDTISGLLIMCMFQHNQEDLKSGFQNLGVAITIANLLGLHLTPPRWVSEEEKELRIRLYWVVHFVDKLYGFSMTLPFGHDYRLSHVAQPRFSDFDYLKDDSDEFKFSSLCSIHYLSLMSELCKMLYLVKFKFNFVVIVGGDQAQKLTSMVQAVDYHLKAWETKVGVIYTHLHQNQGWKIKVSNRFELYLKLLYNSALIQVYQTFNKVQLEPRLKEKFQVQAQNCSKNAIINALHSGNDFLTYGLTYKFYALSNATFYWVKITADSESHQRQENLKLLQLSTKLLGNCTPYYLLAEESLKMSKLLAKSENILLD